jgi:hypothetical protein
LFSAAVATLFGGSFADQQAERALAQSEPTEHLVQLNVKVKEKEVVEV